VRSLGKARGLGECGVGSGRVGMGRGLGECGGGGGGKGIKVR
jgi:hypothetical protein